MSQDTAKQDHVLETPIRSMRDKKEPSGRVHVKVFTCGCRLRQTSTTLKSAKSLISLSEVSRGEETIGESDLSKERSKTELKSLSKKTGILQLEKRERSSKKGSSLKISVRCINANNTKIM